MRDLICFDVGRLMSIAGCKMRRTSFRQCRHG